MKKQLSFAYRATWGGARPGAGRKPGARPCTPHRQRPAISRHHPLHVVLRIAPGVPSRRAQEPHRVVRAAFAAGKERFGFRLVHYSVQRDHLDLIAEAEDARDLTRAMKGLGVRIARRLNASVGRSGRVFEGRYFSRALKTP